MSRRKKNAPPVEIGSIISIGEPYIDKFTGDGWVIVAGHLRHEPDRHATIIFTNPNNARRVAESLIEWANAIQNGEKNDD